MATIAKNARTASVTTSVPKAPANGIIDLKGKGKAAREMAYIQIAPLSFVENISRVKSIANLRTALGTSPSPDELKAAQDEWTIGRVASRLPASEFPKGCTNNADKLEHARKLVLQYAAPAKSAKAKLRAGKIGYRSESQHKAIRAADEAWSMIKAEIGLGTAKTQKEKDAQKKTRATNANPVRGAGKGDAKPSPESVPTHAELVKPTAPVSSDDYVRHMTTQLGMLVAYDQKHARKRPTTHGKFAELLLALKQEANAAANAYEVRKAEAEAKAAERSK